MSLSLLLLAFVIALAFVMGTIIKYKMHPFMSLLVGALIMGLIVGLPLPDIGAAIARGFGNTMGGIGIIIVLGVILGQLLHESGAMENIALTMLRITGEKNAVFATNITGLIVSIPVFFDAAFVILINLIKQLSLKGKLPYISLVCALGVGLITTHCMVIPTPGPLAVADTLGTNIGWMILYGIIVSLIGAYVGGVLYAKRLGAMPENSAVYTETAEERAVDAAASSGPRPSGGLGIFLIFLPICIILLGTVVPAVTTLSPAMTNFFKFIGDKNIALLIGVLVAFAFLRRYIHRPFGEVITTCGKQAGSIFIITGAGGSLAAVINATGIGTVLVDSMSGWTSANAAAAIIVIGWFISQVLRACTGSATVALITTAGILAPIVAGMGTVSPVLVALGICAGGIGVSLPNDSGFWVVNRFSGFSVKQTIMCWTVAGTVTGVTVVVCLLILNFLSGVLPGLMPG
ncbi:MAG: GntP family permease [Planctomycetaceae bacterium]|nr:GntP family permease [Planctomycetaceae bacterium]